MNDKEAKVTALILAAGRHDRWGGATSKLLVELEPGVTALGQILKLFEACSRVDRIVVVASEAIACWLQEGMLASMRKPCLLKRGGDARPESLRLGLAAITTPWTLVHDGARPLVGLKDLEQLWQARGSLQGGGATLGTPLRDSLKIVEGSVSEGFKVCSAPQSQGVWLTHTPQIFPTARLVELQRRFPKGLWRDEVEGLLQCGHQTTMVPSMELNWKLTYPEDLNWVQRLWATQKKFKRNQKTSTLSWRLGQGWDGHGRAPQAKPLFLGGVEIHPTFGCEAHSDGDVLLHAIIDALLGAMRWGDIGLWFPPSDPQWGAVSSRLLCEKVVDRLDRAGWQVDQLDTTCILDFPKLRPHRQTIRAQLAQILKMPVSQISLKAKTTEGSEVWREKKSIFAWAYVVLRPKAWDNRPLHFLSPSQSPPFRLISSDFHPASLNIL